VTLPAWCSTTPAQRDAKLLWFANLNTPEDFAEAETRAAALDV
jgi:molybdopterin-guanine dinucleotide biosynthesis protein A